MNLIAIQEEFIATINAGYFRWSHRRSGGHAGRIHRGAWRKATARLTRLGFRGDDIRQIIQQAEDVAQLERLAEEE